ncbi:MAG: PQQ-binding-like beta-propeller repeat protein [Candidatus Acidiferrales bacterium]
MNRLLRFTAVVAAALIVSVGLSSAARAQGPRPTAGTESGIAVFEQHCMICHGNANVPRAPQPSVIRQMSPERIYEALTTGVMKAQGSTLTEDQRKMLATFLGGRPLGALHQGAAKDMPNQCASNPPLAAPDSGPAWNGWGVTIANTRFAPADSARLTPEQVPHLKVKWAFGIPNGLSAYGQTTVVSGRVFVPTDTGYVYSLNAQTGCVYWSYQTEGYTRTAITVRAVKGLGKTKYAAYLGDGHSFAYALDAHTGKLLWKTKVDDDFISRITAAPAEYHGVVYVPVSSSEEFSASALDYPCCTMRGNVVALNAKTGKIIWRTYMVGVPKPTRKNSAGVQLYAPSGGDVWDSPTIDPKRHAIYFGTGDAQARPVPTTTDAVVALNMKTGKMLWHYQSYENDAFVGGCGPTNKIANCPKPNGPDQDIGNSPILRTLSNGKRVLVFGTKNGRVIALDPDHKGKVLWETKVAPPAARPSVFYNELDGVVWGGAADDQHVYYGLHAGGMVAVDLATGKVDWYTPFAPIPGRVASSAATSAIPGVAFVGDSNGVIHALSTTDGHELWSYDTDHKYDTVNKVPAHGGAIDGAGAAIANGMVYIGSGYAVVGSKTGNVLIAFSAD